MILLVQINFNEVLIEDPLLPRVGVLSVFVSSDIKNCQAKDKNCFKVIWQQDSVVAPNAVAAEKLTENAELDAQSDRNKPIAKLPDGLPGGRTILNNAHPRLAEAKEVCAFSANGISYSQARAKDDCYAHLVEQAQYWKLLWQESRDDGIDFLLLIDQNDLIEKRLDKAWLVRFIGNN
jgi:hypothetical protein